MFWNTFYRHLLLHIQPITQKTQKFEKNIANSTIAKGHTKQSMYDTVRGKRQRNKEKKIRIHEERAKLKNSEEKRQMIGHHLLSFSFYVYDLCCSFSWDIDVFSRVMMIMWCIFNDLVWMMDLIKSFGKIKHNFSFRNVCWGGPKMYDWRIFCGTLLKTI